MKHISITKKTCETNEQLSIISTLFKDVFMKHIFHNKIEEFKHELDFHLKI